MKRRYDIIPDALKPLPRDRAHEIFVKYCQNDKYVLATGTYKTISVFLNTWMMCHQILNYDKLSTNPWTLNHLDLSSNYSTIVRYDNYGKNTNI